MVKQLPGLLIALRGAHKLANTRYHTSAVIYGKIMAYGLHMEILNYFFVRQTYRCINVIHYVWVSGRVELVGGPVVKMMVIKT